MADIIHGLWIGETLEPLCLLSISSFLHFGHEYHLHCYKKFDNVPPGVVVRDANETLPAAMIHAHQEGPEKGSVGAFSDLFRYKLLLEQGGWWMDLDVVCLRPFTFPEPVVFASEDAKDRPLITSGIFKVPAGHPVTRLCYEHAAKQDLQAIRWGYIGPALINHVVRLTNWQGAVKKPAVFCPVPWWHWRKLLDPDPTACSPYVTEETYAVHLWHEAWRRNGMNLLTDFPPTSLMGKYWRFYRAAR